MKQPEAIKNFRQRFENPIRMSGNDEDYLKGLREKALYCITVYKEERKKIEQLKKDEEEVLNYFNYLDSLEEDE